jgi:hypothetical protein
MNQHCLLWILIFWKHAKLCAQVGSKSMCLPIKKIYFDDACHFPVKFRSHLNKAHVNFSNLLWV